MERKWWKEAVVYQIYPMSFQDANGDGIGDLRGIISRLDYLKQLGIDVVWLSPIYQSPCDDNGYDISDYYGILPQFGTMEDFDLLLSEMHKRGIRLLMDLVVNHTSDEHPWFLQSRSGRDNPYRDFYIWKDPKPDGSAPNNWTSYFSGSAWQYDQATGQYYLHLFTKKQPDLNWENPNVRREVYRMMKFWLDKGVDGFRMDVLHGYAKAPGFPDGKPGGLVGFEHFANLPRVHDYIREMNAEVLSRYDIMTVGETGGVTVEDAKIYTDPANREVNMVFQFEHMDVGGDPRGKWFATGTVNKKELKRALAKWQTGLDGAGWNSLYLSNHDQPRQVSHYGDPGAYRVQSAKLLAMLNHLQQGTPYVYQGEELGMTNTVFSSIRQARDVEELNAWKEFVDTGRLSPEEMLRGITRNGRDNARTPVQWDASPNAGFTAGTPWIDVNPNCREINAAAQENDPDSVFSFYRRLIALRKETPVVVYGDFQEYDPDNEKLFVFRRSLAGQSMLVALNLTGDPAPFTLPSGLDISSGRLYISNYPNGDVPESRVLRPFEGVAYLLG